MLRRLLVITVPLLIALGAALGIPLASAVVQQETQATYLDRLSDASRFASIGESALQSNRTAALRDEIDRYEEVYGFTVALVSADRRVILSNDSGLRPARRAGQPRPQPGAQRLPAGTRLLGVAVGDRSDGRGRTRRAGQRGGGGGRHDLADGLTADRGAAAVGADGAGRARADAGGGRGGLADVAVGAAAGCARLDEATAAVAQGNLDVRADEIGGPAELQEARAQLQHDGRRGRQGSEQAEGVRGRRIAPAAQPAGQPAARRRQPRAARAVRPRQGSALDRRRRGRGDGPRARHPARGDPARQRARHRTRRDRSAARDAQRRLAGAREQVGHRAHHRRAQRPEHAGTARRPGQRAGRAGQQRHPARERDRGADHRFARASCT